MSRSPRPRSSYEESWGRPDSRAGARPESRYERDSPRSRQQEFERAYERDYDGSGRRAPAAGGGGRGPGGGAGGGPGGGGKSFQFNVATVAVLAGVLIVGVGIGTVLSSTTQGDQGNIASSQQLDMAVPDPEFCRQWGASAFVIDVEMYTTMNPSSSFVTQPTLKPGCVIRRENWSVLQKEGAVTAEQMRQCKQRMNTFAYIGSVKDKPIVRCVYQTDISENKFITKGVADDAAGITPEANQF
ncbi:MAG: DUF3172 domain-containing protein [Cyanobium sp.]